MSGHELGNGYRFGDVVMKAIVIASIGTTFASLQMPTFRETWEWLGIHAVLGAFAFPPFVGSSVVFFRLIRIRDSIVWQEQPIVRIIEACFWLGLCGLSFFAVPLLHHQNPQGNSMVILVATCCCGNYFLCTRFTKQMLIFYPLRQRPLSEGQMGRILAARRLYRIAGIEEPSS